eukprot:jgi/Tetstr1/462606/TSEL_007591.t1
MAGVRKVAEASHKAPEPAAIEPALTELVGADPEVLELHHAEPAAPKLEGAEPAATEMVVVERAVLELHSAEPAETEGWMAMKCQRLLTWRVLSWRALSRHRLSMMSMMPLPGRALTLSRHRLRLSLRLMPLNLSRMWQYLPPSALWKGRCLSCWK